MDKPDICEFKGFSCLRSEIASIYDHVRVIQINLKNGTAYNVETDYDEAMKIWKGEPQEEKELPSLEEALREVNKMLNEKMDSMNKEPKRCVPKVCEYIYHSYKCINCGLIWDMSSPTPICKHQEGE